jgi:hypothetical protein
MNTTIAKALHSLTPSAQWSLKDDVYANLVWLDTVIPKPTEQEVNAEIARLEADAPFAACKAEAKKRIAATDWSVLPDVSISNRAEFEEYRAELRALIITPVSNPSYPVEPQPVWL